MSYPGREPNAAWRSQANARINQHRKSDLTVRVIKPNGQPVRNARVHVSQIKHDFKFGSYIGHDFLNRGQKNDDWKRLQSAFFELYNFATVRRFECPTSFASGLCVLESSDD